jgi:hypothetical protein
MDRSSGSYCENDDNEKELPREEDQKAKNCL